MFKILFKKQMTELFKSYFFNRKTGKLRPNNQIIMFIILFFGILVLIANSFSGISKALAANLIPSGYGILYFELLGAFSLGFGIFGSVFSSYEMLYNAKDNDFLLSMPIKSSTILSSRLASLYLMSIIYESVIYIPAVIEYCRYAGTSPKNIILPALNLFLSGIAVLALTCLFGWMMAAISGRLKNKNFFTIAASLIAVALYYFVMFRVNGLINAVSAVPEETADKIKRFAYPLFLFGSGSAGNTIHFVFFTLLVTAALIITVAAMSKSFIRLATSNRGLKKKGFKAESVRSGNVKSALLRKEKDKFFNTPVLVLNSGLGLLICPAAAIAALIKSSSLAALTASLPSPEIIPGAVLSAVCFICSVSEITASSISLEGKSLWILKSLPLKATQIIWSKIRFSVIMTLISSEISLILMSIAFGINIATVSVMIIAAAANTVLVSCLGIIFNLKKPDFDWTNETIPVKQDAPVVYSMFSGMGIAVIPIALAAVLMRLPAIISVIAAAVIFTIALIPAIRWINRKGTEAFSDL